MRLGFKVQSLTTDDHRLAKMATQVKDVLPHVPLNVITKDLGGSHSCWAVNQKYCTVSFSTRSSASLGCLQPKPTVSTPP